MAGFSPDEIDITAQQNQLIVSGEKAEKDEDGVETIHRGIAMRAFERRFQLADYVEVQDATYENGLLVISLERVVPEAMKPRKIEIAASGNDNAPQITGGKSKDKAA